MNKVGRIEVIIGCMFAGKTSEMLNVPSNKVIERVKQLSDELNLREKEIRFLKSERVETQKISILRKLDGMEEPKILVMIVNAANASDLRDITDEIKSQFKNFAVVLGTVNDGKVFLVSRVSKTLVDEVSAKEVLELSAEKIGGKGGGRVDFAQAGGNMVKNLDLALKQANQYFIHRLKKNL